MEVIGKALATIEEVGDDLKYGPHGGFTCIASTPSEDRDGDNLYQDEWKSLPEHVTVDLDHGMSVATTVGSGRPYFNSDGNVQTDVALSSIARAQEARTLINEGHIRTVSVAFMTDKSKKSGEPRRELLNLGIVAIPSNREAVILDSKALDARAEELAAQKATGGAETKADKKPYGDVEYADPGYQKDGQARYPVDTEEHVRAALSYFGKASNRAEYTPEQVTHINSVIHRRAHELGIDTSPDGGGKSVGDAEKKGVFIDVHARLNPESVKNVQSLIDELIEGMNDRIINVVKAATPGAGGDHALVSAIHDASVHLGAQCAVIEVTDESDGASDGANKSITQEIDSQEAFEKALDQVLTPEDSPAEAAAATDEVPAPAVEAADEKAKRKRAVALMQLRTSR